MEGQPLFSESFPEENPYPVMRSTRRGELLYANRAAGRLLEQWQCQVGARLPEAVQSKLAAALENGSPQKLELGCGERELEFVLVPVAGQDHVNIYGYDITEHKSAQKALRESERIYRAIGESIDYGVWVCAPDGRNIYASDSFLKLVGISQEQCSDFGWADVLHPDDAERTTAAWKECVRTGGTWDIEHRFRGADGQWHAVLARGVPVKNENGEILCWAGINLDISRLKQTEQALREAHERLRKIMGSISDGFMGLDRQCRVTFVNEKGARDLGQTRQSMLGRVLWEIFPEAVGSEFENAYRQAMNERVATTAESYYLPLKAWFEARAYPSEDGISVFFRDVTDRKTVEQNLREVQADLNRAQAVGQIGSWRLDVQRDELLWSDENHRIFGLPRGTPLTYETFLSIVYPEDREYVDRKWTAALRGKPYDIEHRIIVGETVKWVRERAELEFDEQGGLKGGFGTTQDITARKQAEAKLKQSEEALRRANEQLEAMVRKRTVELEGTVATLKVEIAARKKIQAQLHQISRVFMDAADPIIIEDLSGMIVDMNREAETAYEWRREELIGKSITTLFLPERLEVAMQMRERCSRGEEVRNWESSRKAKSGRIIPSLLTAFPLTDESGGVAFVATICKDISTRKKMEARLQASELQLKELTRKSLQALEADRRTVARELHDSVGGSLSAIKFGLEEKVERTADTGTCNPASLEAIVSDLADAIKETKRISANLRPLMIDDLGLLTTIEWYARQCQERFGDIRIHCQFAVEEREIPEDLKIVVYRVIQEAVTNAARHSRAGTVRVSFGRQDNRLFLEIRDNGSGFDLSEIMEQKDPMMGHGLLNMQQRVEISGGSFSISSQAGEGTCVRASFPNLNQL